MPLLYAAPIRQLVGKLLEPKWQRILLLLILAILAVAGLRPFNFYPKDGVTWMKDSSGVVFRRYGEVVGESPLASRGGEGAGSQDFTVELWITSFNEDPYVKDLLSVYVSRDREPFAIEQRENWLLVGGIFRDTEGHRKFTRIGVNHVFMAGARRFVTLTSGPGGTKIYLEGTLQKDAEGFALERENFDGTLLLGQTAFGRQDWRGAILGLGFYKKEFTPEEVGKSFAAWQGGDFDDLEKRASEFAIYRFDEGQGFIAHRSGNLGGDLEKPKRLRPVDPVILEFPSKHDLMNVSDVTINILGFIPFGLVLVMYLESTRRWRSWKAIAFVIVCGFLISLAIELLQVLLPTRDSSLLDLINNTLGTAIGAGLGNALLPGLRRVVSAGSRPMPVGVR